MGETSRSIENKGRWFQSARIRGEGAVAYVCDDSRKVLTKNKDMGHII